MNSRNEEDSYTTINLNNKSMKVMKFITVLAALTLSMSAMCQSVTQTKGKRVQTALKEKSSKYDKTKGMANVVLYGTEINVHFDASKRVKVKYADNDGVANCIDWILSISDETLKNCQQLKKDLNLCDWAYVKLLDELSRVSLGNTNEATVMMSTLLNMSGYETGLAWNETNKKLMMMYRSEAELYNCIYIDVNNKRYYIYGKVDSKDVIKATPKIPQGNPLCMRIFGEQRFAEKLSIPRTLTSAKNPYFSFSVQVNKNLVDFYGDMPSFAYDNNFMTRWATMANCPLEKRLQETLILQMKQKLAGKSQLEKVQELLWWVQTGFVYEYDEEVWGHDRAFYAEETLFYPYCDAEDRSILLSRLVRDVVGLDVLLVYYPGHLAIAVCFTEEAVKGAYYVYKGHHFVVCDPTYIGSSVGDEMPGMEDKEKKVFLLKNDV